MDRITVKFGGSSVADADQFSKVAAIVKADPRRRIIVVSAPGRRHQDEPKITDLLYLCCDMAAMGTDIGEPFGIIQSRFTEIADALRLDSAVPELLDSFRQDLETGCSRDYAASRGEYFCARLMAEYLQAEFVDPADHIVIRPNGTVVPQTYQTLAARFRDQTQRYVMAGFYGRGQDGEVKTFSRGGSDISGAIAARAAGAILYENWTDTSGILMADPRIVGTPRCIDEISFREVREMSYMGASVFHDEAILPVREAAIPICIKNTNRPHDPGTRIVPRLSQQTLVSTEIAGISGKKPFTMISLEKTLMNKEVGFGYRLLGILRQYNISFEHCPSSIDSISVIIEASQLDGLEESVLDDIRRQLAPDHLSIEHDLALLAVVGEGMARTVGIAGKLFDALARAGINVRIINQGASEINIIIGVAEHDYEAAIRAIYAAFVPATP
ncbi:aspartate kinase [Desulfofustis limnaeus]|jgi:aspartate kinase|uniref:Aspartokinase n=1 Tax=Desulfofustis limnaeus TaxID=2740163 RepID=A0ABN6M8L4_9BACT|nr:aspartate kinase [Desulfofustis limnaeus]MDX9894252.1 aspartate kinase [Desulfofustis sp.]BDD88275.1 aspartokinase [Desulfofustis limnaeus]